MVQVEILNIEKKAKSTGDGHLFVVKFSPKVEGKDSGTVWALETLNGAKKGDVVDMDYEVKGKFFNIKGCTVKVSGQTVTTTVSGVGPTVKRERTLDERVEEAAELYEKCKNKMLEIYKEEIIDPNLSDKIEFTACVNTLFIQVTKR